MAIHLPTMLQRNEKLTPTDPERKIEAFADEQWPLDEHGNVPGTNLKPGPAHYIEASPYPFPPKADRRSE